jgi:hypothetical protein
MFRIEVRKNDKAGLPISSFAVHIAAAAPDTAAIKLNEFGNKDDHL